MHREPLLNLLQHYKAKDIYEEKTKQEIIEFVKQNHDCFERHNSLGHITGSAWLLNADQTKAFLLHHRKLQLWLQPGGHCDGICDVLSVAIKEAQEESGICNIVPISSSIFDLDIHWFPESKELKAHRHYDVRFLLQANGDVDLNDVEAMGFVWVEKDTKLPNSDESVVRMHRKWSLLDKEHYQ